MEHANELSERNLILSIALFATAPAFLFNAKLFKAPVINSEKGGCIFYLQ
jgi:hypothetical protein